MVVPLKVKVTSVGPFVKPPEPEAGAVVPGVQTVPSGAQGSSPLYAVATIIGGWGGVCMVLVMVPDVTVQGGPCLFIKVEAETTPAMTIRVVTLSSLKCIYRCCDHQYIHSMR